MAVTVYWRGGAFEEFADIWEAQSAIQKLFRSAVYSEWEDDGPNEARRVWESRFVAERGEQPIARITRSRELPGKDGRGNRS